LCHEAVLNCLQDMCELTWSSSTFSGSEPDQWYRLILAIFLHNGKLTFAAQSEIAFLLGVIQLVILLLIQLYFCYKIERRIG